MEAQRAKKDQATKARSGVEPKSLLQSGQDYEGTERSSAIGASAVNRSTFSLGSCAAQTKVTVGQAGDRYEREADGVAENVVAGRDVGTISRIPVGGLSAQTDLQDDEVQEKCTACDTDDKAQTASDAATPPQPKDSTESGRTETPVQEKCAPCEREQTEQSPQNNPTAEAADRKTQPGVQTKVAVGSTGGRYENEADNVAERVSRGGNAGPISSISGAGLNAQAQTNQPREDDSEQNPSAMDEVQEKCAACDGEDSAQTSADVSETADANSATGKETEAEAQTLVQRDAEEGGEEADETAEDVSDEAPIGGEDDPEAPDCGESGAGAPAAGAGVTGEGAAGGETEEEGEVDAETGASDETDEEGGEAEPADEEGEGGGCAEADAGEDAAAPEAGPTNEAHGEHACGGGAEEAEEAAEGETAPEGETGEEAAPPPLVPESAPPCADQVAEPEDTSTEMTDSGEAGGGEEEGCGSAQTQTTASENEPSGRKEESDSADADTQAQRVQCESQDSIQEEEESSRREESSQEEDSVQAEEKDSAQLDGESDCAPAEAEAVAQTQGQTLGKSRPDQRRDEKSAIAGDAIKRRGGGQALAPAVREPLEKAMRVDLGEVRVHTGTQAETANKGLRSRAFTHKNHVWLAAGESQTDLRLMAHELTHSVQQGAIAQRENGLGDLAGNANKQGDDAEGKTTPGQPEPATQATPEKGATEEESGPADKSGVDNEIGDLAEDESDRAENPPATPDGGVTESEGRTDTVKPDAAPKDLIPNRIRGDVAEDKTANPVEGTPEKTETQTPAKESATGPKKQADKPSAAVNQLTDEEQEQNVSAVKREKNTDNSERQKKQESKAPASKKLTSENPANKKQPSDDSESEKPDIPISTPKQSAADNSGGSVEYGRPPGETNPVSSVSPQEASSQDAVTVSPAAKTSAPSSEASATNVQAGGKPSSGGGAQVPGSISAGGNTAGRRGAASVPASLGSTDSAASLLRQFSQISPLQAPFHFKALSRGMGELAKKRRDQEKQAPVTAEYRPRAPGLTEKTTAAKIAEKRTPQNLEGLQGGQQMPPVEVAKPHQHPHPAPAVGVSPQDERRVEDIPETDPEATQTAMQEWLENFAGGLPSDGGVSTDPGLAPQITLPGRYNPNHIQTIGQRGSDQLRGEQARRADEPQQDFGESAIAPDAENETVQRRIRNLQPRKNERCPQAEKVEPYRFDDEDEQDLVARTRPEFADDYDDEFHRLDNAEADRDVTIAQARANGIVDVENAHRATYDEELAEVNDGRRRVDAQRLLWREANEDVLLDYEDEAKRHSTEVTGAINQHVGKEQQGIDGQRAEVVKQAQDKEKETQAEKARLEKEAKEKEKSQRSRSTVARIGRWIKRKVVSIANWLSNKLKEAFDKLRAFVRDLFNRFKKWALEQIEKARRWVNEKLEDFRQWAHKTVDRYLGQYPAIAQHFHRAIDVTVDGVQRAVNRTAAALKKRVAQIIDAMAAAVDKALGIVEGALQTGLWFACNLAVAGVNFAVLLIDQDIEALIDFINEMPEPAILGPIWPVIKYALLGFLVTLRDKPEEEKKRYARKIKWLAISPTYYLGVFVGVLKGFVWDGLVGLVVMLKDIIVGIPQAIKAMYDSFSRLIGDVESINAILAEAGEIWQQLKNFINDPDKKEQIVAFLQRVPSIVHEMVREAHRRVKGWAFGAGADAARALYSFVLNSSHYEIGEGVGRIVGRVLFEVALFFFTAGVGTAIKWGAKILQVLSKAGRLLTSAAKGGSIILRAMNSLRAIVLSGVKLAQRVGQGLSSIFVRLEGLVNRVFSWFRRAFGRMTNKVSPRIDRLRRRFLLNPAQRRRWYLFKLTLRQELTPFQRAGIGKARLRALYSAVANRFRDVAKSPRLMTEHGPHWLLRARKVKGFLPQVVARVLLDDNHRWRAGKKAVKKILATLTDSELDTSAISRRIAPLKPRYHYSQLDVVRDESEDDWDVWGAMSPRRKIAERDNTKGLKTGNSPAQAIPIHWYKNPSHYPNPISLRIDGDWAAVNMISNTSVTHNGETHRIGIKNSNMVNVGTKLLRGSVHLRAGAQGRFRTLLRNLGYRYWANKDADHVTDIGFGGEDEFDNLWPLNLGVNRRAYDEKWYLKYRVRYKQSRTKADIQPLAKLNGKWFRVIGFNYRRPMPIGGREP